MSERRWEDGSGSRFLRRDELHPFPPSPASIFLPRLEKRAMPAFQLRHCVCAYVGVSECGGVHMHMCGCGQRTTSVVIPQTPPSPLFLRQGLPLD